MIETNTDSTDSTQQNEPAASYVVIGAKAESTPYLVATPPSSLSKRAKTVRVLGNLLIVVGLVMLVGLGGWFAYSQWDIQNQRDSIAAKFGADSIEPPIAGSAFGTPSPKPTSTPRKPISSSIPVGWGTDLTKPRDTSPPVRLAISSVGIDTEVVPVTWKMIPSKSGGNKSEWEVADFAVGHHYGSANPGAQGNVVLSGHVDYKGEVFKNLHKINKGDEVTVYTEKGQYIYVVTDLVLVKEEGVSEEQKRSNAAYMNPTPDQTLTMITCWPYGIDDHRLIVIGKPYQSPISTQSEFVIR